MSNEKHDRGRKDSPVLSKRDIEQIAEASADEKTQLLKPAPAPDAKSVTDEKSLEC